MSLPEVPFLELLPPPESPRNLAPGRLDAGTTRQEERARQMALARILDSLAAEVSPRHWGINE
jgi:hypothetical protein